MTFHEWKGTKDAENFMKRMEAGEKGNSINPWLAAENAYDAGIKEGKRLAIQAMGKIIYKEHD